MVTAAYERLHATVSLGVLHGAAERFRFAIPAGFEVTEVNSPLVARWVVDQEGERRNPWWGDPSFRILPRDTRTGDAVSHHMHIDTSVPDQDLDSVMPLTRLAELEAEGFVGSSAPSHYSFMGYILKPQELLEKSTPAMIERLKQEGVDAVLLVPV